MKNSFLHGGIMIKVSVIIPIYNVKDYIEECLLSVLNQTLQEIEIICIDDGTLDDSMDIIDSYAAKDERIVIFHKQNGGLSSARNAGLKIARGEYVYFLDSDDYILDNTLELLYNEMSANDLDTIFFDADSFFESEDLEEQHRSYHEYYHRDALYEDVTSGQQLFFNMQQNNDFRPSACLQMNRRILLIDNNIFFEEGIIHEDNLFTMKLLLYSARAKHIPQRFYQRRVRENSIMTSKGAEKSAQGYFSSIYHIVPFVLEKVTDPKILDSYIRRINDMYRTAINAYRNVKNEEYAEFETHYDTKEGIFFDIFVRNASKWIHDNEKRAKNNAQKLASENNKLKQEIKALRSCNSYKIGRRMTFIPRKIKTAARVLKSKGIKGLIKLCIFKFFPQLYKIIFTKVSIIIPVYNGEKYINSCLDSLRKQTLKDIEIILVDDNSTDDSLLLLKKYEKKDTRIKVYEQKHLGAGHARNVGMKHAHGKYLLFLDCDDLFDSHLCEKTYQTAQKKKAEIVLFATQRIDVQTGVTEPMGWVLRKNELPKDKIFSGQDIADRLFQVTSNCPWSKLFHRKFIKKHHLQFQDIKHANDAYFVRTGMALAKRIVVLDKQLVTYRYNDGNNTQSLKHLAPLEFYKAFIAVKERLESEGLFGFYQKSYINWVLTESLFNYNTMQTDEAQKTIKDMLLSEGFDKLGVTGCNGEDIYDSRLYADYIKFIGE